MYLIGLDHRSRSLYSTITIMISLPATIKVVNWTYTLVNGMIRNNLILYSIISFIFFSSGIYRYVTISCKFKYFYAR